MSDMMVNFETDMRTMGNVKAQMTAGLIGLDQEAGILTDAIFAGQHIMLEGEPGVGKTELVKNIGSLVFATNSEFKITTRLQGASDRQPADFLGAEVYNQQTQQFEIRRGPIFGHFVLADEINRNNTKTQAALNEAMAEGQVTIGKETLLLPRPFMVIATQNTHEFGQGTNQVSDPLLDRFGASAYFEAPTIQRRSEVGKAYALDQYLAEPKKVLEITDLLRIQEAVRRMPIEQRAIEQGSEMIEGIISTSGLEVVSKGFRSIQAVVRLAQANAWRAGKSEATIEEVKQVMPIVMAHRIKSVGSDTDFAKKQQVIYDVLKAA
ncbi:MAG: AAA family ATPase [Candidatus Saccharibacteria bacterium]|nr:AAA family ATPase [Candidatus Saccharibacteria bacterium]